jgi:hypothetical protein
MVFGFPNKLVDVSEVDGWTTVIPQMFCRIVNVSEVKSTIRGNSPLSFQLLEDASNKCWEKKC